MPRGQPRGRGMVTAGKGLIGLRLLTVYMVPFLKSLSSHSLANMLHIVYLFFLYIFLSGQNLGGRLNMAGRMCHSKNDQWGSLLLPTAK